MGALFLGEKSGTVASWPDAYPPVQPDIRGLDRWLSAGEDRGGIVASRGLFPVPEIASRCAVLADVQHNPDPDGIYRRARLFRVFDGKTVPSFALACLMAASPRLPVEISEGSMTVAGKRIPIDREGNAILRFRGASGKAYRHYSAAAVIQSELKAQAGEEPVIKDPDAFRGRHVIFGFSAPGSTTCGPRPWAGVFPGSEIHATALDNLLSGDFMRRRAGRRRSPPRSCWRSCPPSRSSSPGRRGTACSSSPYSSPCPCSSACSPIRGDSGSRWWSRRRRCPFRSSGPSLVNYATEGKQKRFIKGAFQQYLSPAVIEQLIAHPERLKLGGERRDALDLLLRPPGIHRASRRALTPEELTALLNEYLSAMTDIIQEEGGTVDKYEGDAIIAFWNAPARPARPRRAGRARRAALPGEARGDAPGPPGEDRQGPLHARSASTPARPSSATWAPATASTTRSSGDAVNLASRLEGINKQFGTYILASEALLRSLPGPFPSREISTVAVVGRKEPVRVFELLSRKDLEARGKEISSFAGGLEAFTAGNFPAALETFLSTAESDPPAASYARKCRALIERPPERWEGVWVMTEK